MVGKQQHLPPIAERAVQQATRGGRARGVEQRSAEKALELLPRDGRARKPVVRGRRSEDRERLSATLVNEQLHSVTQIALCRQHGVRPIERVRIKRALRKVMPRPDLPLGERVE